MSHVVKNSSLAICIILLAGCVVRVDGTGIGEAGRVEQSRHVEDVGEVVMGARGRLHIAQGEQESLRIEGRKSALEDLKTYQRGDVLIIENRVDLDVNIMRLVRWSYPDRVNIYLTVKSIDAITLKGHGDVELPKIKTDSLHLDTVGHGDMVLGKVVVDTLFVTLQGHGDIKAGEVMASRVEVDLDGHGNIHINFLDAEKVGIDIEGHGEVELSGKTVLQSVDIDGHGDYYGTDLHSRETGVTISGHGSAQVWATDALSMDVDRHATASYRGDPKVFYLRDNVTHVSM